MEGEGAEKKKRKVASGLELENPTIKTHPTSNAQTLNSGLFFP